MESGDEDLRRPTIFVGTLSRGEISVPIRFQLLINPDGDLRFRVFPVPATQEAFDLRHLAEEKSDKSARYSVQATSKAGTRFMSDSIYLSRSGIVPTRGTDFLSVSLAFKYSAATFSNQRDERAERPVIRHSLRGFECHPQLRTATPLGELVMHGTYPSKKDTRVSGYMMIAAPEEVQDSEAWCTEAARLFEHVRDLMSFALSHFVMAPIQDSWVGDRWERRVFSQTKMRRNAQHVLHPMLLQDFFDKAAASFFAPPVPANNLSYAIEWFSKPETYSEMRLTNVMTALENLIDSNLAEEERLFLSEEAFEGISRSLRHAFRDEMVRQCNADSTLNRKAADELVSALPSKMQDLNRRSFESKLKLLAERWNVPLHDLPAEGIAKAIAARNSIVHRGYYYEPEAGSSAQRDLWDHVLIMREVVIRFVLTAIGFKGKYLSFRGGQHDVEFPPA